MGGRGSSYSGGSTGGTQGALFINRAAPRRNRVGAERRPEVVQLFKDIGFNQVTSLKDIPTPVLSSVAAQIQRISKQMGGVVGVDGGIDSIGSFSQRDFGKTTLAYVQGNRLMLNAGYFSSPRRAAERRAHSQKNGWHAGEYSGITAGIRGTITHELGHALHNKLVAQEGKTISGLSSQIKQRAKQRYRTTKSVSTYGKSSDAEFFAESISAAYSSRQGAYGRAARDVLGL